MEDTSLTVKQEIKAIDDAMKGKDENFLARYGGFGRALQRSAALQRLPEAKVTEGVSIDDYRTFCSERIAGLETGAVTEAADSGGKAWPVVRL